MTMVAPQLVVNESVVFAELDDEAVLLNIETGVYFGLDEVGTEIWNLLTTGAAKAAIVEALLAKYEVDAGELAADVSDFIATLETNGLVRAVGSRQDP
jgi:coenzyme PQQ synthesis protein D (PqqD)